MTRFLASVPGYVYAQCRNEIYVNLYAAGTADVKLDDGRTVKITQETRYPWDGSVKIKVEPDKPGPFTISLRIPGWACDEAVPGDLYKFMDKAKEPATIKVKTDGVTRVIPTLHTNEGYVPMAKSWQSGDEIELNLPMPVRRILANDKVADDAGKVALQRLAGVLRRVARRERRPRAQPPPTRRGRHISRVSTGLARRRGNP